MVDIGLTADEFDALAAPASFISAEERKSRAESSKRYRGRNVEELRLKRVANREKHAEQVRAARMADPEGYRKKYNAGKAARKVRLAGRSPGKCCEICHSEPEDFSSRLVWDHDHNSGNFRGWICDKCNRVLGFVKDSPWRLEDFIFYLEKDKGLLRPTATELNVSQSICFGGL